MNEPLSTVDAIMKLVKQGHDSEQKTLLALAEIGDLTKDCPRCAEAVHTLIVESLEK
jgi:hypothetical protein